MAKLGGARIGKVVVIGVEPEIIEPGMELTDTLRNQIPAIVKTVKSEIESPK
jgi:hypothetical protein